MNLKMKWETVKNSSILLNRLSEQLMESKKKFDTLKALNETMKNEN
jgi:hypothetical protein